MPKAMPTVAPVVRSGLSSPLELAALDDVVLAASVVLMGKAENMSPDILRAAPGGGCSLHPASRARRTDDGLAPCQDDE